MPELYLKTIKTIFANRSRAILTIFSIAIGVCAVIVTVSIADMGSSALNNEIEGLGISGIAVSSSSEMPLSKAELGEIQELSYVQAAVPLMVETTEIYLDNDTKPICLWGMDNNAEKTISMSILSGRFFNSGDIAAASRVCIIDEKLAEESCSRVGKFITIRSGEKNEKFRIIGIIKTGSGLLQNMMGSYIPDFVYVPYSTVQNDYSDTNFSQIIVRPSEENDSERIENGIVRAISGSIKNKDKYSFNDLTKQKESLDNIILIFTLVLSAVGGISLIVAGINTMNIMLVSVKEKTREIGIKKSLGARTGTIVLEFLIMSAVLSLLGALTGIAAGSLISLVISHLYGLTLSYNIAIITIIVGFTVISGTAFGIYPALKAAELDPVEALRYF